MHYSEIQKENFYLEGLEFGLSENEAFKFANWKQSVVDEGVSSLSIGVETFQAIEESQLKIEACLFNGGFQNV